MEIDHKTKDGSSSLILSAKSNHESVAIFLLSQGANPMLASESGHTALNYATKNKNL